jgi:hypothetical protein
MTGKINEREILKHKIQLLLWSAKDIPKSKQTKHDDHITDAIIVEIGKMVDECKTIEEVKKIFRRYE